MSGNQEQYAHGRLLQCQQIVIELQGFLRLLFRNGIDHIEDVVGDASGGIGISKDKVPSIFERFTTVSKENDMQPSSGIGLSLVNELVKMLHGEIQVESEVKKGSVFKLVLHKGKEIYAQDKNVEYILNDTSEEQETVLAEPEQNDKTSLPDMPPATKETLVKVMVVEDNAELRQFICEILSGTYRVVGVADGVMALEKIEEEIPDFIITDIMMPRMDGIELIRHIKEKSP